MRLTLHAPTPRNGQTYSKKVFDKFFECVWPFCGIGTYRVNSTCQGPHSTLSLLFLHGKSKRAEVGAVKQIYPAMFLESLK